MKIEISVHVDPDREPFIKTFRYKKYSLRLTNIFFSNKDSLHMDMDEID